MAGLLRTRRKRRAIWVSEFARQSKSRETPGGEKQRADAEKKRADAAEVELAKLKAQMKSNGRKR